MSKTLSEEIDFALCCISECCVDESKRNITSRKAIEQIREYLNVLNDDRYSKNFNVSLKREIREKDQLIAELEEELASQNSNELVKKKYDSLKEVIKFLWEKQITDEHIFYVIDQLGQQHIDRIQDIENGICEIERLNKLLKEKGIE